MLRKINAAISNRMGLSIQPSIRNEVRLLQVQQLKRNSLILYFIIIINTFAGATVNPSATAIHPFFVPSLFVLVFIYRFYDWRYRTPKDLKPEEVRKILARVLVAAILISMAASLWSLSSYLAMKDHLHGSIPLFVVLSAYAAATCLSVYPAAALIALGVSLAPMSLAMLFSPQPDGRAIAASIFAVTTLQAWIIVRKFGNMVRAVQLQRSMRLLAETDALTGLANRRGFEAMLEAATQERKKSFSVVMLDLDRFKHVNDTFGHAAGDFLLVEVALRLRQVAPGAQLIARLGGDEFAMLVNYRLDQTDLRAIRGRMSEPYSMNDDVFNVGASVGCAIFPLHGTSVSELMSCADAGLYACKRGVNMTLVA